MKGFGYIIEGFASGVMLLLFLGGAFLAYEAPATDWVDYRTEVSANDIGYVSQTSGDLDPLIEDGESRSIDSLFRGYTSAEMDVRSAHHNFPTGLTTIGVYVPEDDRQTISLTEQQSGDKCDGQLSELNSETDTILRTEDLAGSIEREHGTRLYLVQQDSGIGSGAGDDSPNTVYVDNGTSCQFATEDGPFLEEEMFFWGDRENDNSSSYYEVQSVNFADEEMEVWETELSGELSQRARRSDYRNQGMRFDGFNQSQLQSSLPYDIVVFHGNETIEIMDNNLMDINRILQSSPVVLVADIEEDDLDSGFLSTTGLRWVDLDMSSDHTVEFPDTVEGTGMEAYFDSVGCYSCDQLELNPGGKVSSSTDSYLTYENQHLVLEEGYDVSEWNLDGDLSPDFNADEEGLIESGCNQNHWSGDLTFPEEVSTEALTVFSTQLGLDDEDCDDDYAIQIDKNGDGVLGDPVLDQGTVEVNNREYVVSVNEDDVEFTYVGESTVEAVNYRDRFPDTDIEGFARIGNLTENGELGGETGENLVIMTALLFELGRSSESGSVDSEVQKIHSGLSNDVPYFFRTRWER